MKSGKLILKDGSEFFGCLKTTDFGRGEVVFTTGMCGYIESLTDPSFSNQILVFTYPLIGNHGVEPIEFWESNKIQVSGIIVGEVSSSCSHYLCQQSLIDVLLSNNIPILSGVDTRQLTKHLRTFGNQDGVIQSVDNQDEIEFISAINHVNNVSINEPVVYGAGNALKIIVVDCGIKNNILRCLLRYPFEITMVPFDFDYSQMEMDGVVLSNGPGDPCDCVETIQVLKKVMAKDVPIFGICLGHQLLAMAAGGSTYKMKFGHRGQNQPCKCSDDNKCYLTSQNHGFAVNADSLNNDWKIWFVNINDGSVEGIRHVIKPFFSVQFHPEAAPGPEDTKWIFDRFYECVKRK